MYRSSSHTVFDIRAHVVWCTKYRYKVMTGDLAWRCRDLLREICRTHDVDIMSGKVGKDCAPYAILPIQRREFGRVIRRLLMVSKSHAITVRVMA